MSLFANVNGTWKVVSNPTVKVNNAWKQIPQIFVNINGVWKPLFTFTWEQGAWSSCSATCGGGTQTRTVRCKRNDGTYWPDSICSTIGTKPTTSQSCNTHGCPAPKCYDIANTIENPHQFTRWALTNNPSQYYCGVYVNDTRVCVLSDCGLNSTITTCGIYTRGKLVADSALGIRQYEVCF